MNQETADGAKTRATAGRVFWREAFALKGAVEFHVTRNVIVFTLIAMLVVIVDHLIPHGELGVDVAPYEVAGAALGLLLVLRTNAGYDRWWEARKLWGGIVNQTRCIAISGVVHGPDEPQWQDRLLRWTAAYAHVCRRDLRRERDASDVARLLGDEEARKVYDARHMPTYVSIRMATLLREAADHLGMDRFAFLTAETARCTLIDHVGGCERILKTPLPRVYSINIRRFIVLFLLTLPFALLSKVGWLAPVVIFLVSYPILTLDQIGVELQNPFAVRNLGHLPLDDICDTIERDLLALSPVGSFPPGAEGDKVTTATQV